MERYLLLLVVVLILLVTLFATLAARRFTPPIDMMVDRLNSLDPDSIASIELDRDELSELAQALNGIGQRTRVLTQAIAQKNRERDKLLSGILPNSVVGRWQKGESIVDSAEATVIVIQIGGIETAVDPTEVAKVFNELIVSLDKKGERLDVERANCFGKTYIATCGLTKHRLDRLKRGVDFANNALNLVNNINRKYGLSLNLQIGIDDRIVTAALIGEQKFRYDLWGEPVSVATGLAHNTQVDTIRVTQAVSDSVEDMFAFIPNGSISRSDKNIPTWTLAKTGLKEPIGEVTSSLNFGKDDFDVNTVDERKNLISAAEKTETSPTNLLN